MPEPREIMAAAMEAKRADLIAQPLARIWPALADAALFALSEAGYVVVKARQWQTDPDAGHHRGASSLLYTTQVEDGVVRYVTVGELMDAVPLADEIEGAPV